MLKAGWKARATLRRHVRFAAVAQAFAGASLLGWLSGVPVLTTLVPGRPALAPMTALLLLLGAMAAVALPEQRKWARTLAGIETACGCCIAAVYILELPASLWIPAPWWSSKFTGVLFAFCGSATLLLAGRHFAAGQLVAFGVLLFSGLVGLAHVFPTADLYRHVPGTGVAIPTVLAFVSLSLSLLLACRSEGIVGALGTSTPAGGTGLRLWLVGLASVLALAISVVFIHRSQAFDTETAILLVAWGSVALFGGALWGLAIAVDRAERARRVAELERDQVRHLVAAAVAHDLRSPLQSASMTAALLAMLATEPPSIAALERLQRSHRRLDRMLRSLLDALALDGGRPLSLRASQVSLHQLVWAVVDENRGPLGARVCVEGEATGWWDQDALFRVLENLLLNAVKYGEPETPIVCRIHVPHIDEVHLFVENQGRPIPRQEWNEIFQPFARSDAASNACPAGWGVGLAYARSVALSHGGTVEVTRSDAVCTRFELRIPVDSREWLGSPA